MEKSSLDILWVVVASGLVYIMQAGFAMVESGLTRSKNSINVAIKNLTDLGISTIFFWAFGFAVMFGLSRYGVFGSSHFAYMPSGAWPAAFFLFQVMFCSTSATIVSGAVAERMKYSSYIISTVVMSALIYPVFGHWAWGGMMEGAPSGWLGKMGFVDFAGSTVVHSMGGWVSLALLLIIGPRTGRFGPKGESNVINGSNIPMAVLGVMILWFGWFGFNGGSTLAMNAQVAKIIINTTIAGSAGMVGALAIGWPIMKKPDVNLVLNGSLAGLVAITANCHAVNEWQAVVIGVVGGAVMIAVTFLLERLRIDDAVGAIPVHLGAGIWGTIAVAVFGHADLLATGLSFPKQLVAQLAGIAACGIWAFSVAYAVLFVLNRLFPIRVSVEDEYEGLNKTEHGVTTEITDFYRTLHEQSITGDMSRRAPVEPFTEIGQIARIYNNVMDKLESNTVARGEYVSILDNVSDGLFLIDKDGVIGTYYSAACEQLFQRKEIAGGEFIRLIDGIVDGAVKSAAEDYLPLLFDGSKPRRLVDKLNPLGDIELMLGGLTGEFVPRHYQFHFRRVMKDGVVSQVMVLVRDVTRQKELAREVEQTRRRIDEEMELFYGIIHVDPGTLARFLADAAEDLESINSSFADPSSDPAELISGVFRRAHAIKGDADMLGLDYIANKAHELESAAKSVSQKATIASDDFLKVTIILSEIRTSIEKINSVIDRWSGAHNALSAKSGDTGSAESSKSMNSMGESEYVTGSLRKLVDRLAERHGKRAEISFTLNGIDRIGGRDRKRMREILVQLVRNSMYHGIETPEERTGAGKSAAGQISVSATENDGTLDIRYRDDGRGLDGAAILRKAVERGIITEDQSSGMSERDAYPLIFRENFSTADGTDLTAGRGVGMALVKNLVAEAGGRITLRSRGGEYLEFDISVPTGGENAV